MHFTLFCRDKPDSLDLRLATRTAHLGYVQENLALVRLAGPILDEKGDMAGSFFILEAESRHAVEAFLAGDPYQRAGLFAEARIDHFRLSVGALA